MQNNKTIEGFLNDQIANIKNLWHNAITLNHIVPIDVNNYDECIAILSNELCGPNDIRLARELYPIHYDKRQDLLAIFNKYFSPLSILNQEILFKANILPTCAYVGEYALWHRKDYDNMTSIFPTIQDICLPEIDQETNFFEENDVCYRRVSRGCNDISTIDSWLTYYMQPETQHITDTSFILSLLDTLSPGILSDVEKMEQYVKCYESFFVENRDSIYKNSKITQDKMVEYINGPKFNFTNNTLEHLKYLNEKLAEIHALFFLPLTSEQQEIVNETFAESIDLYTKVENGIIHVQQ